MEVERKGQRKRLGEKFRRVREEQGWSTEQVSLMADLTAATVEKIEAGAFNVPLDVLVRVADVLGVELTVQEV
jgi:transcriptional regulator with XRE-family HTH domain